MHGTPGAGVALLPWRGVTAVLTSSYGTPRDDGAMNRRVLLGAAAWLAVAATATAAGVAAIGALEDGITGSRTPPLDREAVQRALNRTGAAVATVPTSPPSAGEGVTRVLGSGGGTVTARCAGGRVTLLSWTPAQGFRADDPVRGPAKAASLKFESNTREYRVTVTCDGREPKISTSRDDRHHGHGGGD
jgi:hypothetical protein